MNKQHYRSPISNKTSCEPSSKTKHKPDSTLGAPASSKRRDGGGKARLSAYLRDTASRGEKMNCGEQNSQLAATHTFPSECALSTPCINRDMPPMLTNATCTFVDSVISLCNRSLASSALISEPVPPEDIFLLLVRMYGVKEAKYWAELFGFEYKRSYEILAGLLYGRRYCSANSLGKG